MAVDLHLHTNHSDGSLSPQELVYLLKSLNVSTFAITDHDTISAIPTAMLHAKKADMILIPGVELSIDYPLPKDAHLHLLGLFIDVKNTRLQNSLKQLRFEREKRANQIIQRLKDLNINLDPSKIDQLNQQESIGRPHIAKLLVEHGYVKSMAEAFSRFIGRNAPAYIPKKKFKLHEAVELVHHAHGLAIIAHPISLGFNSLNELQHRLDELTAFGIDGLEAYYSTHDQTLTQFLLQYAKDHRLAVSGGSDFHGEAKKEIQPVTGLGNLKIPDEIVPKLFAFHQKRFDR